jgi:protease I
MTKHSLAGKQILMVIAPQQFRDEELFVPKSIFEEAGATVKLAASRLGQTSGMLGGTCQPDILIADAKTEEYEAIIVVGGSGSPDYLWSDAALQRLVKQAAQQHRILGAICLAGVVLARAGVLQDRKATVYKSKDALREYEQAGVQYSQQDAVVSGQIVTASGPRVAAEFGQAIMKLLRERARHAVTG